MNEICLLLIIIYMLILLLNKSGNITTKDDDKSIQSETPIPKFSPDYENPKARFTWSKRDGEFIKK